MGGLTNAVSGHIFGYNKPQNQKTAFGRSVFGDAAASLMNKFYYMSGINGGRNIGNGYGMKEPDIGMLLNSAGTGQMRGGKCGLRSACIPTDAFSGGIGCQATRGYQPAGTLKINSQKYVRFITNASGHYAPTVEQGGAFSNMLNELGIRTKMHGWNWETTISHRQV